MATSLKIVALLAEGVDRNMDNIVDKETEDVALLAEGVDRNYVELFEDAAGNCRPPRGGRG